MIKNKSKLFLAVGVLTIVACLCILFLPCHMAVLVEGDDGTKVYMPCKTEDSMVFEFEHSMYHVPQREYYFIQENGFLLDHVYFGSDRAVVYYDPQGLYEVVQVGDREYEIRDMNQLYPSLSYLFAHGTQYTLSVSGLTLDFNSEFLLNSHHFTVCLENASLFQLLTHEVNQ